MSFPINPIEGETTIVNGDRFIYKLTGDTGAWVNLSRDPIVEVPKPEDPDLVNKCCLLTDLLSSDISKVYDLTSQVGNSNTDFTLNPAAIAESIVMVLDGQILAPMNSNGVGDFSIISNTLVKLSFVPEETSNLLAIYVSK